jgi:uroporphyrinogen-III decarboxylase
MCQLALGHYFLHSGLDPVMVWHDTPTFATALVRLQQRYGFDGILVNLPGRDPQWRRYAARIEYSPRGQRIEWGNGFVTVQPVDDNPRVARDARGTPRTVRLDDVDPARIRYVEPHDNSGVRTYDTFPPWQDATVRAVRELAPEVSVHAEVFSPLSQVFELVGPEAALMALVEAPTKVEACLEALTGGTVELMGLLAEADADAILVSSAFAGAGFISPGHYRRFVLPYERRAIAEFRAAHPGVPVYTHTCGAVADRLELIAETGTSGIDTLDPPPLGDVDLADAKRRIGGRLFIKGNVDPVNTMLRGTRRQVREDAERRLAAAMAGGGYILSTACSVAPATPPENILQLRMAAEAAGRYPG